MKTVVAEYHSKIPQHRVAFGLKQMIGHEAPETGHLVRQDGSRFTEWCHTNGSLARLHAEFIAVNGQRFAAEVETAFVALYSHSAGDTRVAAAAASYVESLCRYVGLDADDYLSRDTIGSGGAGFAGAIRALGIGLSDEYCRDSNIASLPDDQRDRLLRNGLAGKNLCSADLHGVICERLELTAAQLVYANLSDVGVIVGGELSHARLDWTRLYGSRFNGTTFAGANFYRATLNQAVFQNCTFDSARFECAEARHAEFVNVSFRNAYVCGADFRHATFENVDWSGARYDSRTKWPDGMQPPADAMRVEHPE